MNEEEQQHIEELLNINRQRLRVLELQRARKGINAEPEVIIEIEKLSHEIRRLQSLLPDIPSTIQSSSTLTESRENRAEIAGIRTSELEIEPPSGTMAPGSHFYVMRKSDTTAMEVIQRQGVTMTIKGPRQIGKSSLLMRIKSAAEQNGKRAIMLDFQRIDVAMLTDASKLFRFFCSWVSDELDLADQVDEFFSKPFSYIQCCSRYFERYLLKKLGAPLLLAMDEVDSLIESPLRSDFFGMLRSWHNERGAKQAWRQFDLALVTSTEPYQLIENPNQSPFNVGETFRLEDFSLVQVADLNRRHGSPLSTVEEHLLYELLGGHPYLVRRALYLVASGQMKATDLFKQATAEDGPFDDHLRNHLTRLHQRSGLVVAMLQVIRSHSCPNESVFFRLQSAGLVHRVGGTVVPRCRLYADYFREHLPG